jgi:hypothetical protein
MPSAFPLSVVIDGLGCIGLGFVVGAVLGLLTKLWR